MIILAQADAFAKIRSSQRLVDPGNEMNAALIKLKEVAPVAHQTVGQYYVTLGKHARELTKQRDFALSFASVSGRCQIENHTTRKGKDGCYTSQWQPRILIEGEWVGFTVLRCVRHQRRRAIEHIDVAPFPEPCVLRLIFQFSTNRAGNRR